MRLIDSFFGRSHGAGRWLVCSALAFASFPPQTAASAEGEARSVLPSLEVEQYQLPNGLTVLLNEDHALPVVSVEVVYLVGSGHERPQRTGFAHLFEHLMFQGSANYDNEYFKPFAPLGGRVNGTTNKDRTNFYETVPSNHLETALWMESDRMANLLPALTQAKLDNQREVVKNERRERYENTPYGMFYLYLSEALYPQGHPYRHTTIGSHEDLTAATLEDVRAFFKQYYVPANAALAIVGDFEPDQAKQLVSKYFGGIAAGERENPPQVDFPQTPAVHMVREDDVPLPRIHLAWHTPALFDPGDAELDLLSSYLTDGKSSRLNRPLVFDGKIAKSVTASQYSQKLSSMYVIEATAAPGQSVDTLYSALMKELAQALEKPPTPEELERAVNGYKKSFYGRVESVQPRASTLCTYFLMRGTGDYLEQDMRRYLQATPEQVHAIARQYLDLDQFVRIDIVPRKSNEVAAHHGASSAAKGAQQ